MNTIKVGPELIELLGRAYRANTPVLMEGSHGVGKSESIKAAAQQEGIDCIVRDLSLMEPPDLTGMPKHKEGRTVYAPPSFLPKSGKGILVIEELNRAEKYMLAPCLQLLTERSLNDYRLPDGWVPMAAINPDNASYDVNQLDPALRSRFICVAVAADQDQWLNWAVKANVHPAVRQYVRSTADIFETSNPRSWTMVSNVLRQNEEQGAKGGVILQAMVAGLVDDKHARALLRSYVAPEGAIAVEDLLSDYGRFHPTILGWCGQRNSKPLQGVVRNLLLALQNSDTGAAIVRNDTQLKALTDFAEDLPDKLAAQLRTAVNQYGASL